MEWVRVELRRGKKYFKGSWQPSWQHTTCIPRLFFTLSNITLVPRPCPLCVVSVCATQSNIQTVFVCVTYEHYSHQYTSSITYLAVLLNWFHFIFIIAEVEKETGFEWIFVFLKALSALLCSLLKKCFERRNNVKKLFAVSPNGKCYPTFEFEVVHITHHAAAESVIFGVKGSALVIGRRISERLTGPRNTISSQSDSNLLMIAKNVQKLVKNL